MSAYLNKLYTLNNNKMAKHHSGQGPERDMNINWYKTATKNMPSYKTSGQNTNACYDNGLVLFVRTTYVDFGHSWTNEPIVCMQTSRTWVYVW